MRYKILYDNKLKNKRIEYISARQMKFIVAGLIVTVTVLLILTGCASWLQEILFHENVETARRTINDMSSDLKNGESVVDVVYTFCKEIIDRADMWE